jgi:hypothetical protein
MLKPRTGLTPASRRRIVAALGLALAVALTRVSRFGRVETRTWRGVPDVAHISGEEVDVEFSRHVDIDAVESIASQLKRWDGVTVMLDGRLGVAELGIDIDVYANEYVAARAGIINEKVDVLAEPRGHVEHIVVESFYELLGVEREKMKEVFEEFVVEMHNTKLNVATYAVSETRPLWSLVAEVYVLRDYSFAPEGAIPLWHRPWIRQMARYLYRLAPPEPAGLRRVVEDVAPELLKYLTRWYEVKLHEDALQLMPMSTRAHRDAVAELKNILAQAMKAVAETQKIINEDWGECVKEELRRRLLTPS